MVFEVRLRDASALFGYYLHDAGKLQVPAILHAKGNLLIGESIEGNKIELKQPDVVFTALHGYFPAPLSLKQSEAWKVVNDWIVVIDWRNLPDFRKFSQELCIFPRGTELFSHPRLFVEAIVNIRQALGSAKLLYVPGIALASRIALLSCLRIDLFDDALARWLGEKGILALAEGIFYSGERCTEKNLEALAREMKILEEFAKEGRLRELVEMRIRAEPEMVAMLRYMDMLYFDFFEKVWPSEGKKFFACSKESLWRADVVRYRERIKEYAGINADVVLLLPCAAKKPYHLSRSHMLVEEVLKKTNARESIHVLSLTSPLGVVPEELEIFYPANSYDIPVTGHWDSDEKRFVVEGLEPLLRKYRVVIAHLPEDYRFVVEHFGLANTCKGDDITDEESLKELANMLEAANIRKGKWRERLKAEIGNALKYQFPGINTDFLARAKIEGNRWEWRVWLEDELFWADERHGRIFIGREGGRILAEQRVKSVGITDFVLKGDVFVPGIIWATEDIRAGDEVVVVQEDMPVGTGKALLSGIEMQEMKRGIAVKMRERWTK